MHGPMYIKNIKFEANTLLLLLLLFCKSAGKAAHP